MSRTTIDSSSSSVTAPPPPCAGVDPRRRHPNDRDRRVLVHILARQDPHRDRRAEVRRGEGHLRVGATATEAVSAGVRARVSPDGVDGRATPARSRCLPRPGSPNPDRGGPPSCRRSSMVIGTPPCGSPHRGDVDRVRARHHVVIIPRGDDHRLGRVVIRGVKVRVAGRTTIASLRPVHQEGDVGRRGGRRGGP